MPKQNKETALCCIRFHFFALFWQIEGYFLITHKQPPTICLPNIV